MADEQIKDASRSSINLGIDPTINALPDIEIHSGSSRQFVRMDDIPGGGRARRSPGNVAEPKPAAKSQNPGQADIMEQLPPQPHPIRAEDFQRATQGTANSATPLPAGPVVRGPVSPEDALFGPRKRIDTGQQPDGQPVPLSGGRVDNRDESGPRRRTPVIDTSPSVGANVVSDIAKTPEVTRPATTKQPDISFLGRGPADAWGKENDK